MPHRSLSELQGWGIALILLVSSATAAMSQPREEIDYWRTKYPELKSTDDARVAKAHDIFKRLVQVAGSRPGMVPRLYITASEPWDMALPIAIRDGWIILSRGVIERCYQDTTWGADRLAFVLAHELAHQLQDELWHIRFFDALEATKTQTPVSSAFFEQLRESANASGHVLARELRADEHGIIYAAMAGFNAQAIVSGNHDVNFFADWVQSLDPRRIPGATSRHMGPTPQERAEALRAALRRVANQTTAFQAGLWFYYAGHYPQAIRAFDYFRSVFPNREVYHNLAVSHHQLALQAYRMWQPEAQTFPFQLSLVIEPLTRASQSYLERTRGPGDEPKAQFQHHLHEAIQWYRQALSQDPTYTAAALNLGAALILRGANDPKAGLHPDFTDAHAILSRALEQPSASPRLLNTLGIALFYIGQPEHAQDTLRRARTLEPDYSAPVFNLAMIARAEQRASDAQRYQQAYTQLTTQPVPAAPSGGQHEETVAGMLPGTVEAELAASWGQPIRGMVQIDGKRFTLSTYSNRITTLAQDGEVLMLMVQKGYKDTSTRGVALGSREDAILTYYGPPSRRHDLPDGQSLAYDGQRIAFQLHAGQVVSWLRF